MNRPPQRVCGLLSAALAITVILTSTAYAANNDSSTANGSWFDASAWTGGVPAGGDGSVVRILDGHTISVSTGIATADQDLDVGGAGTDRLTSTLLINGGTLTAGAGITANDQNHEIGVDNRTGIINLTGGALNFSQGGGDGGIIFGNGIGPRSNARGSFNQSGGVSSFEGTTIFGNTGGDNLPISTGTGSFSGGQTLINGQLRLGGGADNLPANSLGVLNITGTADIQVTNGIAAINNHDLVVGYAGMGVVSQDGGTITIDDDLRVGGDNASNRGFGEGTINISGGSFMIGDQAQIAIGTDDFSQGRVTVSGGLYQSGDQTDVGIANNSQGSFTVSGGIANFGANIGANTAGLEQDSGIGAGTGSIGSLIVGGTGVVNVERDLSIGLDGNGELIMTGGAINTDGDLHVGFGSSGSGFINLSGGVISLGMDGEDNTGASMNVGVGGVGVIVISGGTITALDGTGDVNVANTGGVGGSVAWIGGGSTITGAVNLGRGGLGTGTVFGGTHTVGTALTVGDGQLFGGPSAGTGTLNVTGGLLAVGTNLTAGRGVTVGDERSQGTINVSGGTVTTTNLTSADTGDGFINISGGLIDVNDPNSAGGVRLGDGDGGRGELVVSGSGLLDVQNSILIGDGADAVGSLLVSGGTVLANTGAGNGRIRLGNNAGGTGFLTITSGLFHKQGTTGDLLIGRRGIGVATVSGGTLLSRDFIHLGTRTGGNGLLDVSGTALVESIGDLNIGEATGAFGSVNMTGGAIDVGNDIIVGNNGTGTLIMSGGVVEIGNGSGDNGDLVLGNNLGSVGTLTQSAGLIQANIFSIGRGDTVTSPNTAGAVRGIGVYSISGGTVLVRGDVQIGFEDDSSGTYTQTAGAVDVGRDFRLGVRGTMDATLNDDVSPVVRQAASIGAAEGTADIGGGVLNVGRNIDVGVRGTGILNISGTADINVVDDIRLGSSAHTVTRADNDGGTGSGNGTVNMSGGTLDVTQIFMSIQFDSNQGGGNSQFNLSGGALNVRNRIRVGGPHNETVSTFNMTGGTLTIGTVTAGVGTIQINNDTADTLADVTGGLIQTAGPGADLVLNSNQNSDLNIAGGTLNLRGGDILDTGGDNADINLSAGAILNANGVNADLTLTGGLLDIGADGSQRDLDMLITGGDTYRDLEASAGTIVIDLFSDGIAGSGAGGQAGDSDATSTANSAIIGGDVNLAGATIVVSDSNSGGGITYENLDEWDILDWFLAAGDGETSNGATSVADLNVVFDFSGIAGGVFDWNTSRFATQGIIFINQIPEPSRAFLLLLGLAALTLRRHRNPQAPGAKTS